MTIEHVGTLFTFMGGLGMFLYGMSTMGDGLQKAAGNKMRQFLAILTNNRLLGVVVGLVVTGIIQSSSATTVMVVGFVNAGLMNLTQAVGVIMGANIGTTVTAWLVSMNEWEWAAAMKPSFFAPFLIGIGAFLFMFAKSEKKKDVSEILIGFGVLFIGLEFMSDAIKPYSSSPVFANAFKVLGQNPILGILAGMTVTAIIQSSSASVGILQTLAMTGAVSWSSAIFITLGQNIGTCITAILSSAGAGKNAKRAATIHLMFNTIGAGLFGIIMFVIFKINTEWAASNINSVQISIFHTIFNISNTVILFPFANLLVKIAGVIIKEEPESNESDEVTVVLRHLDERILESPTFAVENVVKEVVHMGEIALDNTRLAINSLLTENEDEAKKVIDRENIVDKLDNMITEYLVKISNLSLTERQQLIVNHMFYTVSNIERVGDHAENIAELALKKIEHKLKFSKTADEEMKEISKAALDSFENAIKARSTENVEFVRNVVKLEDLVDNLEEDLREKHITRLSQNQCDSEIGVIFIDTLVNLERISDHSMNIANYVKDEMD
ncbi:Na/Pi cotransporter family protein [Anaeromicropila populeti]|uniref:Phosphate:Na+ symporter n=1 Tax=Anaeromicropila populeti TaxID=37658 RepID=A0A1I6IKU5_9FIRM|nr:Na/Pi cotransporter family protein [Anaeromicropila populeti]SFR67291.1 phosphate:Na+ symporter [Anaeromicropila populeti]